MKQFLTSQGKALLKAALEGGSGITFSKMKLGNGMTTEILSALADETQLAAMADRAADMLNTVVELKASIDSSESYPQCVVLISDEYSNSNLEAGFHITEIGIYAENPEGGDDILYSIGYTDEGSADYVPDRYSEAWTGTIRQIIYIGDVANITAVFNAATQYAPKSDFDAHIQDKNNPHGTTKAHVGLGSVPNVSTNDQTPTFTESQTLSELNSGEKLSVLFGKLKKAVKSLIQHLNDKNHPHAVTASLVGAAEKSHTHSAVDINSGSLSAQRGGTGKNKLSKGSVLVGNDNEPVRELSGTGALFSSSTGQPEYGTLPVSLGGTGLTEGARFTGTGYGCRGSVILPGGLLMQWGRLKKEKGEYNVTVNFDRSYRDTNYVLLDTSNYGSSPTTGEYARGVAPAWYLPERYTDKFTLQSDAVGNTEYSDWLAVGFAAEQ